MKSRQGERKPQSRHELKVTSVASSIMVVVAIGVAIRAQGLGNALKRAECVVPTTMVVVRRPKYVYLYISYIYIYVNIKVVL